MGGGPPLCRLDLAAGNQRPGDGASRSTLLTPAPQRRRSQGGIAIVRWLSLRSVGADQRASDRSQAAVGFRREHGFRLVTYGDISVATSAILRVTSTRVRRLDRPYQ